MICAVYKNGKVGMTVKLNYQGKQQKNVYTSNRRKCIYSI